MDTFAHLSKEELLALVRQQADLLAQQAELIAFLQREIDALKKEIQTLQGGGKPGALSKPEAPDWVKANTPETPPVAQEKCTVLRAPP